MKEENKIRAITLSAILLSVTGFFLFNILISCCTPNKLSERFSTKEYKEAIIVRATIVWIDSAIRSDHYIGRIYWEDTNKTTWYTECNWPTHYYVGFSMPLFSKR